ncbi:uncharacterized protein G2W53_032248 [Senna tora]|uniref:Uncharacterized protein n=1 Tax=Senna tora TaxID=362788 RepID=A0A834SXY1_9FABA|nr:uncharacterized protein G2W53_032248 [Senna tora]
MSGVMVVGVDVERREGGGERKSEDAQRCESALLRRWVNDCASREGRVKENDAAALLRTD